MNVDTLANRTIAITGAYGFLGNVLVQKLLRLGAHVRALRLHAYERIPEHENLTVTDGDIRSMADLRVLCHGADMIFHSASFISIAQKTEKLMEEINVGGTENILHICKEMNVQKLVYISSVEAIGKVHQGVHTELDNFNPEAALIPYGKTKAIASNKTLDFARMYQKEHHTEVNILCPSGICGPFDTGTSLIGAMIQSYINRKLRAFPSQGGFCFVDVRDVADATIQAAKVADNGSCYIVSSEFVSSQILIQLLEKVSSVPPPRIKIPLWAMHIIAGIAEGLARLMGKAAVMTTNAVRVLQSNLHVSSEKMQKELNIHPLPIEESFKDQVQWYRASESTRKVLLDTLLERRWKGSLT